jgi:hypothetical protein
MVPSETGGDIAPGGHRPARVVYPAIMLAAMAVECASNAVIAETKGVSHGGTLNFPEGSHDLKALAEGARIKPADDDEADAIRAGWHFTTWKGRFPSTRQAKDWPRFSVSDEWPLVQAYRRIFVRAAEHVAPAEYDNQRDLVRPTSPEDHAAAGKRRVLAWLAACDSHAPYPA